MGTHGGARPGAGRPKSIRKTVSTHWRISLESRDWILQQAKEQGVTAGDIIDVLIQSFEDSCIE